MSLVYVIQKTEGKQPVSDKLLLEEALYQWKVMGYKHPEYQTVMFKGPVIPIPERLIEAMYVFVSGLELQETSDKIHELLDGFSINTFTFGGDHESGS